MTGFVRLALSRQVWPRATKVALLVGTLLALINHGDAMISASITTGNLAQIVLTYLVPYAVSTYSSVGAIRQSQTRSNNSN